MAELRHASGAPLWGVSAEFETPDGMLDALRSLRDHDFGRLDAFSPVPVAGAADAMGTPIRKMHGFAVGASIVGGLLMFGMCTYATIWGYRFDVGGRPLFSWPSFIVPAVSFGGLIGAVACYTLLLVMCRLPRLNHPAFNIPGFTRATAHRFFVAVEAREDQRFDADAIEAVLAALPLRPYAVRRVPR